jgi:intracellular multiplication protein IcmE
VQVLQNAMSAQAQSLITAWQPPKMQHVGGSAASEKEKADKNKKSLGSILGSKESGTSVEDTGAPLIKAGTIYFGILETAVDSDFPDTPVMVTIIQGPFKGAKLLGKLTMPKDQEKLSLNFTLMNKDDWAKSKTVTAFAIDPDTARTVLASEVDHHYLKRYGALFASSFMSGYASAISSSGSVQSTGIFGTTTTTSPFSPAEKIAVGLGQVGTNLTKAVANYANTPVTVRVNSGVGLGILFMNDVTQ